MEVEDLLAPLLFFYFGDSMGFKKMRHLAEFFFMSYLRRQEKESFSNTDIQISK